MNQPRTAVLSEEIKTKIREHLKTYTDLDLDVDLENAYRLTGNPMVRVVCNKCGYVSHDHFAYSLHKKKYKCIGCSLEKSKTYASKAEHTYISHESNIISASCNLCSTVNDLNLNSLVKGYSPLCAVCIDKRLALVANSKGFDFLKRYRPELATLSKIKTRVLLKCQKAGHLRDVSHGDLDGGKVTCPACRLDTYREALAKKNCKLIKEHLHGQGTRVYYVNEKNEEFSAETGAILSGYFATSLDGQWRDKNSTYIIRLEYDGKIFCKIGTAQFPEKRRKHLKLLGESTVSVIENFADRFAANSFESILHQEFKPFKLDPTIASIFTTKEIRVKRKGQCERAARKDGVHEWFTHEVYDILKGRYRLENN